MSQAKPKPAIATPASPAPGKGTVLICLVLVVLNAAVYWPVLRNGFVNFDDPDYVSGNPRVLAGLTTAGLRWAFVSVHSSNWHPLTWLSHMLDAQVFGQKPAGHHAMNVAWHALNSVLLFLWLRGLTRRQWAPAFVAALFALHPMHVESVAWISERKDVLSACFGILTLWAYTNYARRREISSRGMAPAIVWYVAALVLLAAGLLAKPMLVTWPCVMLLLDFWPLGRGSKSADLSPRLSQVPWARLILEKAPFFVIAGVVSYATFLVQKSSGAVVPLASSPLEARVTNALLAYVWYLAKLIWPVDLAVFYPHPDYNIGSLVTLGAFVLLACATVGAVLAAARRPYLFVGWFWFVGTLVPVIGLVQVGRQAWADRYTYLPYIGLFIVVVWFLAEWSARVPRRARWWSAVGGLALLVCGVLSFRQVGHWRTTKALFLHALEVAPNNFIAHAEVANVLMEEGQYDQAVAECQAALRLAPAYPEAFNTLGNIYLRRRMYDDAITNFLQSAACDATYGDPRLGLANVYLQRENYPQAELEAREALRLSPLSLSARFALARALHSQGKLDDAAAEYRRLLEFDPGMASVQRYLGNALVAVGRPAEAIVPLEAALKLRPKDAETMIVLGLALSAAGQLREGQTQLLAAIQLQPTNALAFQQLAQIAEGLRQPAQAIENYRSALKLQPALVDCMNNLAWLLATTSDPALRNGTEAIGFAERACQLTEYKQPLLIGTLAAAYAEAGRFPDAVVAGQKARDLAFQAGQKQIADRNGELLELYKSGRAYHETP